MYSRRVDDEVLDLGVSGKLWHGVLVMFDRASGTHWTQLDGRAITGEHAGARLEHRESVFTTWAQWVEAHPETLVLRKEGEELERQGSRYADYFADPDRLMFAHLGEGLGGEVGPKEVVLGLSLESGAALAVTERVLEREGALNVVLAGRPLAILRSPESGRVVAVERELDGRVLVLAALELDDPTAVVLDLRADEAIEVGRLERVRVDRAYWYAWARSHPGGLVLAD